MKGNFFENIKDKISKATAKAYEYESYESQEDDDYEEYEDEQQESEAVDNSYEKASRATAASRSAASSRSTAGARTVRPSYTSQPSTSSASGGSYGSSSSTSAYGSDPSLYNTKSGASYSRQSYGAAKQEGGNIYRMDPTYNKPSQTISKVLYFSLDGPEDARNVADAMMKKDSIILAEFSKLSELDVARVLSFIDGVRYICKAQIEQLESFQLIVPEFIQLSGDFYSQVLGR